jgi:excisionase family DNA binding protein
VASTKTVQTPIGTQTLDSATHDAVVAEQRLLTIPEAARYLGCSVWSVRDLIWKGDLPYTRFGRRFQVDIQDLDALIEREKRREGADLATSARVLGKQSW